MGRLTKIGLWLDKRFPEKLPADEVYRKLESLKSNAELALSLAQQYREEVVKIAVQVEKLAGEVKSVRDFAQIKARVVPSAPSSPFAMPKTPPGIAR